MYKAQAEMSLLDKASAPFQSMSQRMQAAAQTMSTRVNSAVAGLSGKFNSAIGGMMRSVVRFLPFLTGAGLVYGMVSSAKAAAEQEAIFSRLQIRIEAMGLSWGKARKPIMDTLQAIQDTTKYGDTETAEALINMLQYTDDLNEAMRLLHVTMDFATISGRDLTSAVQVIGRVLAGDTAMLKRYGIILKEDATDKIKELIRVMKEKYPDAAKSFGKETAGTLARIGNYIGDFKEAVGTGIIASITKVWNASKDVGPKLVALGEKIGTMLALVLDTAASVGSGLSMSIGLLFRLLPEQYFKALGDLEKFVTTWRQILGEGLTGQMFWDNIYFGIEKGLARITGAFNAWAEALKGLFRSGPAGFLEGMQDGVDNLNRKLADIDTLEKQVRKNRLRDFKTEVAEIQRTISGPGQDLRGGFTTTPGGPGGMSLARLMGGGGPEEMAMGQLLSGQMVGAFGIGYGGLASGRAGRFIRQYGVEEGMKRFNAQLERESRLAPGVGFLQDRTPSQIMSERAEAFRQARPVEFARRAAEQINELNKRANDAILKQQFGRAEAMQGRASQIQQQANIELKQSLGFNEARLKELTKGGEAAEGTTKAKLIQEAQQNIRELKKALGEKVEDPIAEKIGEAQKAFEKKMEEVQDGINKRITQDSDRIIGAISKNRATAKAVAMANGGQMMVIEQTSSDYVGVPTTYTENRGAGFVAVPLEN